MTCRRGRTGLLVVCGAAAVIAGCGKKGPPLAPLARVPAAPGSPQAVRIGDEVYISFVVPSANVSGQAPADITAVDLYAATAALPPPPAEVTRQATRLGRYAVVALAPPGPGGEAPAPPVPPGFLQGATATVRETLTPDARMATPPPAGAPRPAVRTADEPVPGPLVAPGLTAALRRHYVLVAVGRNGRPGSPAAAVSVPVTDGADPPTEIAVTYTDSTISLAWQPAATARRPVENPETTLLPSKPLLPPPPPTAYHVFEIPRPAPPEPGPYELTRPRPLTAEPVVASAVDLPGPVEFGRERCFEVRPVDEVDGVVIVGRPSAPACVTPVDTFPPAAPRRLAAIAGVGVINLIWEANDESDLAGYIVLRGPAPEGPLQALTREPIRDTTYRDATAVPGVRYVYAVVAVDTARPPNVSAQSNRVEEESRQP